MHVSVHEVYMFEIMTDEQDGGEEDEGVEVGASEAIEGI